ncbi:MAG: FkbM family methyltransferase [Candidatus Methanofishera endochildressiae]|uniref:FkbM family methyltransferase n=1 Tax=Candidatus Methanofishera endochildressiae TaxID=2738884 RepID=A0A7Z0MP86_9GAMM|nr:FkbM family methyltransferase [Candidatus Methanofishera endochildressiae]
MRDITHIHIFILDVEGGELEALHTMNWNIPVDFWVIELHNTNPEKIVPFPICCCQKYTYNQNGTSVESASKEWIAALI